LKDDGLLEPLEKDFEGPLEGPLEGVGAIASGFWLLGIFLWKECLEGDRWTQAGVYELIRTRLL
jgi:hypothetical protein